MRDVDAWQKNERKQSQESDKWGGMMVAAGGRVDITQSISPGSAAEQRCEAGAEMITERRVILLEGKIWTSCGKNCAGQTTTETIN